MCDGRPHTRGWSPVCAMGTYFVLLAMGGCVDVLVGGVTMFVAAK